MVVDVFERDELPFPRYQIQHLFLNEMDCTAYLEQARWPDGFVSRLLCSPMSRIVLAIDPAFSDDDMVTAIPVLLPVLDKTQDEHPLTSKSRQSITFVITINFA